MTLTKNAFSLSGISIILFLFLPTSLLFSQGTISGTIYNPDTNEKLIGATILVEGTDWGESSDLDGNFSLKLAKGTYNLSISYVGYLTKKIEGIIVEDEKENILNIQLFEDKNGFIIPDGVTVIDKVIKTTENSVLIATLNSDRLVDGISQSEMTKQNIGNALQAASKIVSVSMADGGVVVRGLGDRYSTAQINGASIPSANPYKNSVNLDLIPAGMIANIITSKTFTPDQPGTFTGGNVNIETTVFPEKESFKVSFSTSYNVNSSFQDQFLTHDGGNLDWLGYDDGYRSRSSLFDDENYENALLRSAGTKAKNNNVLAQQVEELYDATLKNMSPTTMTTPLNHGIGFNYSNYYEFGERKLGLITSGKYSRDFKHYDAGLRNYALESTTSTFLNQNFNLQGTTSIESPTVGGMIGLSFEFNPQNTITFNSLYNHTADKSTRYFAGEYNTYQVTLPEIFEFRELYWLERSLFNNMLIGKHDFVKNGSKLEWLASASIASQNEPELRYFGNEYDPLDNRYAIRAPSEYDYPNHFFRELDDKQYEIKVDYSIPFLKKINKKNKLKAGVLYSRKDRSFDEKRYSVQEKDAVNYQGDNDFYFSDENSGLISLDANGNNIIGNYLVDDSRASNSYIGSEKILAGYFMATIKPVEKLDLVFGARSEQAILPVESADSLYVSERWSLLPSINLRYAMREKMNLRAAFSKTVARPNLRELAPFSNFDFRTGAFIVGNPTLKMTSIINIDIRWEWSPKNGELIALSSYYKSFTNPIVLVNLGKSNPEFQYQNVDEANVYGIEFEFRKNLGFLSSALNNFKWGFNCSYIYSAVAIDSSELADIQSINPEASSTRTFFNQSPYILNSNISYFNENGIDAALSFNIFGDRLSIVGSEGTPDIFEKARPQLDFTISKQYKENLSIRLSAQNLLDPEYKLESTFKDQEFVYSNYRLGRTISMSLSYTLK